MPPGCPVGIEKRERSKQGEVGRPQSGARGTSGKIRGGDGEGKGKEREVRERVIAEK